MSESVGKTAEHPPEYRDRRSVRGRVRVSKTKKSLDFVEPDAARADQDVASVRACGPGQAARFSPMIALVA